MARNTRQQRRQRREQQQKGADGAAPAAEPKLAQRARSRQQQVRPGATPPKQQTGRREPVQRGRFVRESWGELKKVEWPGRNQVFQGVVVVIIACAIVGAYLFAADRLFQPLVEVLIGE